MPATHTPPAPSPAQAALPAALDPFLRDPEQPLAYRWWTRWADHHAGSADARYTRDTGPRPLDDRDQTLNTPWLARLFYERDTAIRAEQRTTAALVAVLDAQIATTQTHRETLESQLGAAADHLNALEHTDPAGRTPTVSEQTYSTDTETATRSANLHAHAVGAARSQLSALEAGIRADTIRIAELTRDIASHQHILDIRTLHLTSWYQRRAATYTRAYTARTRTAVRTPEPEPPAALPGPNADRPALAALSYR